MKNILNTMQECDAILQTLIHDIGSHQVQAADLAIRLRTAANMLDPLEYPGSVGRPHGMFQTVVQRSTVLDDSDDARALRGQLQQELDRYHSGEPDFGAPFREVEPTAVRVGDRIRILDITLYYRQWTEFRVHRAPDRTVSQRRRRLLLRVAGRRDTQAHLRGRSLRTLSVPNILFR